MIKKITWGFLMTVRWVYLRIPLINRFYYWPIIKKHISLRMKKGVLLAEVCWFTSTKMGNQRQFFVKFIFPRDYCDYYRGSKGMMSTNGHMYISDNGEVLACDLSHPYLHKDDVDSEFEDIIDKSY